MSNLKFAFGCYPFYRTLQRGILVNAGGFPPALVFNVPYRGLQSGLAANANFGF